MERTYETISSGMVVYYDKRGKKTSMRKIPENISLRIRQLDDSLLFMVRNGNRKDLFISSKASVIIDEESVVSISIPESNAGLYFIFENEVEALSVREIVQEFQPTCVNYRAQKLKLTQIEDTGPLKRRKPSIDRQIISDVAAGQAPPTSLNSNGSFPLSAIQSRILQSCLDGANIFFTGGAGTGKSTLLKALVKALTQKLGNQSVYVTATTGLAACSIGGVTVHQFGGIKAKDVSSFTNGSRSHTIQNSAVKRWKQVCVLIVDEISMLGPEELEFLDRVAKESRSSDLPMGGIQVIFTGDFFQLPPVQNSTFHMRDSSQDKENTITPNLLSLTDRKRRKYCFESPIWNALFPQKCQSCFVLSEIYRQSETRFVSLLDSVRWGDPSEKDLEDLNLSVGREIDCEDGILPTQICTHRAEVDLLNSRALSSLSNDLEAKEYQAIDSGESGYLHMLQKYCPAKERITLKVGAQVILVKTIDPSIGLVNGAKGVVIDFTNNTKRPVVKFTNSQIQIIGTQTFSISLGKDIIAQRVQIPLDLSWAISVHKSQGMTLERAILDLKNSWEYGQVYVALSRVRDMDGLSLRHPLTNSQIKTHSRVKDFYRDLFATSLK